MTDSLRPLLEQLPAPDRSAADAVRDRAAQVLRPAGALERLDEVAAWLAEWQRTPLPAVDAPAAIVFVADHGVASAGVSAYPSTVTEGMLQALGAGVATASVMAKHVGASLRAIDVGVGQPSGNLRDEPALDPDRFGRCLDAGRKVVAAEDADLLVIGEMGIGNTTAAAAICTALFGGPPQEWTGRGTGVDARGLARKTAVVEAAAGRVAHIDDPLEILRQLGGAELVACAGAALEARRRSIPVLLDGFVVTASVAPLEVLRPGALDHCVAGHCSGEPGHRMLLDKLGKQPLLDLGLRLGEASGALAALPLVRIAAACVTDVATFDEWGL